jgi:hypothetical protein
MNEVSTFGRAKVIGYAKGSSFPQKVRKIFRKKSKKYSMPFC